MIIHFEKYHGTGNDFIMIDSTNQQDFYLSNTQISQLCDRRFGIGADGIIILFKHPSYDFRMQYHNPDGSQSFCGNGARCAVKFAHSLNLFTENAVFEAIDGKHEAGITDELISLKMNDVKSINHDEEAFVIDTGSPHFIDFKDTLQSFDIVKFGQNIRYSDKYKEKGINVNVVEKLGENHVKMLTYERGVEDETYSCGTGATAVALAYSTFFQEDEINVKIDVKGGELTVKAKKNGNSFENIYLIGPAFKVFTGRVEI